MFGTVRQRPWIKLAVGLSGQELIPSFNRDDVDKALDLMIAAIDMGRDATFRMWDELAYPVGAVEVWVLPRTVD